MRNLTCTEYTFLTPDYCLQVLELAQIRSYPSRLDCFSLFCSESLKMSTGGVVHFWRIRYRWGYMFDESEQQSFQPLLWLKQL